MREDTRRDLQIPVENSRVPMRVTLSAADIRRWQAALRAAQLSEPATTGITVRHERLSWPPHSPIPLRAGRVHISLEGVSLNADAPNGDTIRSQTLPFAALAAQLDLNDQQNPGGPLTLTMTLRLDVPGLTRAWLDPLLSPPHPDASIAVSNAGTSAAATTDAYQAGRQAAKLLLTHEPIDALIDFLMRLRMSTDTLSREQRVRAHQHPDAGLAGWHDADPEGQLGRMKAY